MSEFRPSLAARGPTTGPGRKYGYDFAPAAAASGCPGTEQREGC